MIPTDGSIKSDYGDYTVEQKLFTYSESEKQENELNKMNSKMILNPGFIPLNPKLLQNGYSRVEATLFGFIEFFLKNNDKFYCTNEQMAKMLNVSENTISTAISGLKNKGLIQLTYKMRGGGGKIRFLCLAKQNNLDYDTQNFGVATPKKDGNIYNNIIENNNINILNNSNSENENLSLPKQEENKTTADLTFDKIYQNYYHKSGITRDEKASKKAFDKMGFTDEQKELILQDEKVFKVEWKIGTKLGTKIWKYRPGFDKYIQSLNIDDLQRDMRLKEIAKWHMDNADNQKEMEERYDLIIGILGEDLAKTFANCCREYIRNKNKITLKLV